MGYSVFEMEVRDGDASSIDRAQLANMFRKCSDLVRMHPTFVVSKPDESDTSNLSEGNCCS